jgi:hypothetical protein
MEIDYWRTGTISEAQDQGYSHLRVTCQGCGKITDLPWAMILRPGITRDMHWQYQAPAREVWEA